jgi:hypothetical protein
MTMEAIYSSETSVRFNGLRGIKSQKMAVFIVTAVRTSNPKYAACFYDCHMKAAALRGIEIHVQTSKRMYEFHCYMSMDVTKLKILGTIPPFPCHHGVVQVQEQCYVFFFVFYILGTHWTHAKARIVTKLRNDHEIWVRFSADASNFPVTWRCFSYRTVVLNVRM